MQLSSISLAITALRAQGGAAFNPVSVFGADLVTYYGNSVDDLWRAQSSGGPVTLYQDSAGTTPVTAIGQSVGLVLDQSLGLAFGNWISGAGWFNAVNTFDAFVATATGFVGTKTTAGGWGVGNSAVATVGAILSGEIYEVEIEIGGNTTVATADIGFAELTNVRSDAAAIPVTPGVHRRYIRLNVNRPFCELSVRTSHLGVLEVVSMRARKLLGNHLTQPTATARPKLIQRTDLPGSPFALQFDGVDDRLLSGNINLTSTDKLSVVVAAARTGGSGQQQISELDSGNSLAAGRFMLSFGANGPRFDLRGDTGSPAFESVASYPALGLLQAGFDIAGAARADEIFGRWNGSQATVVAGDGLAGGGNFGSAPLSVGARVASTRLNGDIFALPMIVKRLMTPSELAAAEKAFGKSIGVLQ